MCLYVWREKRGRDRRNRQRRRDKTHAQTERKRDIKIKTHYNVVKVVFDFNPSTMEAAPVSPILLMPRL